MGVKIRKKGNYLYLDIMYKGKRRWESIGLTVPKDAASRRETMAQAEAIRHKRELQLASERYQLLDPVASKETIIEYAEKIAATYDKKAHLPKSLRYLRPYAGDALLCDVDERFVDGYRAYLLEQKTLGAATAKHYLDALKTLLFKAERERLIERNPAKGVKGVMADFHELIVGSSYLTLHGVSSQVVGATDRTNRSRCGTLNTFSF